MTCTDHSPGDVRADGFVFHCYVAMPHGGRREWWLRPKARHRQRLGSALHTAKARALKKNVPFDIDVEYLDSIYPEDGRCPALGVELVWGKASGRNNSPSLDRINPALGYVRGNVRWMSQLANQIKTNATTAQVCAVADYLKKELN